MPEDELERYFKTLVPSAMQRGRVEGQEIPAAVSLRAHHHNQGDIVLSFPATAPLPMASRG